MSTSGLERAMASTSEPALATTRRGRAKSDRRSQLIAAAERLVAARPEIELLSARRGIHRLDDWDSEIYDDEGIARDG